MRHYRSLWTKFDGLTWLLSSVLYIEKGRLSLQKPTWKKESTLLSSRVQHCYYSYAPLWVFNNMFKIIVILLLTFFFWVFVQTFEAVNNNEWPVWEIASGHCFGISRTDQEGCQRLKSIIAKDLRIDEMVTRVWKSKCLTRFWNTFGYGFGLIMILRT